MAGGAALMGTDIHVIVERRTSPEAPWQRVPHREQYYRQGRFGFHVRPRAVGEVDAPAALRNRDYDVFALLADVRNGVGFAGIEMSKGWTPLAEPRGLPTDTTYSDKYDDASLSDDERDALPWLGDHSFSHATLAELETFFAQPQSSLHYGVLSLEEYKAWKWRNDPIEKRRAPDGYCGGVSGLGLKTVQEAQHVPGDGATHIRVSWQETIYDSAHAWIDSVLPWLTALAIDCGPENVRLVFGFDS